MIHIVPVLRDNYCYILEGQNRECLIIDPGEAAPVQDFLTSKGLTPVKILNTHHHGDHTAGNAALKQKYSLEVIGPEAERVKIPTLDRGLRENDMLSYAGIELRVIETPGHTQGHIVFYSEKLSSLFSGDTLFSMGCGRLLEGSADDMFSSLQKLKSLPASTQIYCGHEYTESNGAFALSVEPGNSDIVERMKDVQNHRGQNLPTLPVSLATELKTNLFLRADTAQKFAGLRARKDNF